MRNKRNGRSDIRNPRSGLGFTLFEVLLAMAILGVVLSVLYLTFHQSMAAMAHMEERADVIAQGRMILERMTADLKGSFLPTGEIRPGSFRYGLVGRTDAEGDRFRGRIDFTALAPPHASLDREGKEVWEVGYFLDFQPGANGLTLFRRQDDATDGDLLRGGRSLALCDRVRSLRLAFFPREGKEQKEWNSLQGREVNTFPVRIAIELLLEDLGGRVHGFRTQVALPLAK